MSVIARVCRGRTTSLLVVVAVGAVLGVGPEALTATKALGSTSIVTLSGVVRLAGGRVVPGASVSAVNSSGGDTQRHADAAGFFSVQVPDGPAQLTVGVGDADYDGLQIPQGFAFTAPIDLQADTVQDLTIPTPVTITAHVVD